MTLQGFFAALYGVANTIIIPTIIMFTVVAFIFNVIRYFIVQSDSDSGRESARRYMIWSLAGFVVVFAFWGILTIFLSMLGIGGITSPITPDYFGGA